MVPANRDGVRTSDASDKPDRGAQEQAQTPGQIASRSTSTQARPALLEPLSTELLDIGSREKRTALWVSTDGAENVRDPEGPDKAGGLKHSISTGLPHRRTRSMVGPVSPLCVVPSTTPATHVSLVTLAKRGLIMYCLQSFLQNFEVVGGSLHDLLEILCPYNVCHSMHLASLFISYYAKSLA